MNKLTTILASTLLATSFGVASAAGSIGSIDLKDVKIFNEMEQSNLVKAYLKIIVYTILRIMALTENTK